MVTNDDKKAHAKKVMSKILKTQRLLHIMHIVFAIFVFFGYLICFITKLVINIYFDKKLTMYEHYLIIVDIVVAILAFLNYERLVKNKNEISKFVSIAMMVNMLNFLALGFSVVANQDYIRYNREYWQYMFFFMFGFAYPLICAVLVETNKSRYKNIR